MSKLLMISGDRMLAQGKKGAFYNTLEEFHKYWERIDIICPKAKSYKLKVPITPRRDRGSSILQSGVGTISYFDNVFIHPSPWPMIFQPWFILKKGLEIYRQQGFNLVTVHEYAPFYNGLGARMLWYRVKIPYVLEIHHITGYPKPASFKEKFYLWLFKIFVKSDSSKAVKIRTVNQKEAPDLLVKCGVAGGKIIYIPSLYIDLDIFKPLNLEKKYDLIFVGRLAPNKGIDLFLKAAKKLNSRALIIGDGILKEKIKLKIENLISVHGWAKDSREVAELMNMSKLLVMPSYSEGGPRVVLEAMACGVPVLATPVGVVPDLMAGSESGEVISWDPDDISKKAKRLLEDNGRYEKYRQKGLEIAGKFEKKGAIKNYADNLRSLIDGQEE